MLEQTEKNYRLGRWMYTLEAAFEYLLSILVAGSFLATLTAELGMSDSLTGILSSVISLGCLFQLLSVPIRPKRQKPFVIVLSIINQVLFLLLYVIPLSGGSKSVKIGLFIGVIFLAYLTYYIAHPKKINWLMSLVDDHHRGSFTANKEIISLLAGMAFSFGMGALVDHFAQAGQLRTAFILSAVVLLVLTLLHTLSMAFTVEKPLPQAEKKNTLQSMKALAKNKKIVSVAAVFVLYYISTYCATPFYGTYLIHEMAFSLKLVTGLSIVGSISRVAASKFWGRYADRTSFSAMVKRSMLVLAAGYVCMAFAAPSTGVVFYTLYILLHGIALGGVNSAMINLVFDYAPAEQRSDALAICQAAAGTAGFLATLAASPLVAYIQSNGNRLFGLPIYAQQVVSVISVLFLVFAYVLIKKEKKDE